MSDARQPIRKIIGRYIVADDRIQNGQPTFRGTTILVADVLEQLAQGASFERLIRESGETLTEEGLREAVILARQAFLDHEGKQIRKPEPDETA
jgi:uncharacterized protein (DUF433 family)